jgi:hypothetical protein
MTVLAWPTLSLEALPASIEWGYTASTQVFRSPLSKSVRTLELPGAAWFLGFSLNELPPDDAAKVRSFLLSLRGQSGRFYMHALDNPLPRGVATGTPVISGAGQSGVTLVTSGWTPSTANILREGDYFGVGTELKMLTADANTNGSGVATLTFEPPLRSSPVNGAAIVTNKPTAVFKMNEDVLRWATAAPLRRSFQIAATEIW